MSINKRALYYKALQDSHAGTQVDCRPFIEFMLDAIVNSLYKYIDVATQIVPKNSDNVGVNMEAIDQILALLAQNSKLSAK